MTYSPDLRVDVVHDIRWDVRRPRHASGFKKPATCVGMQALDMGRRENITRELQRFDRSTDVAVKRIKKENDKMDGLTRMALT